MRNILFILFFFSPFILFAHYEDFEIFQEQFTHEEIAFKLHHFLQKSKATDSLFKLTPEAFYLFASPEDKFFDRPEFVLKLSSSPKIHPPSPLPHSLKDLKIAIDPGHVGGDFAKLEQRYIKMLKTKPLEATQFIYFKEGVLALMTALLLQQWFEEDGAVVFLTKEKDGQAVYEKPFFEWLALEGYKSSLPWNKLFENYNRLDLQARARKINAFHPHLTLIIHYNAHGNRDPFTQENFPENYNYNMAFIGGSFCKGELNNIASRYEFLRLLLSDDIENSLRLSQLVIDQFTEKLHVPPVSPEDPVPYLAHTSLRVGNGVYARNLALTRMVHGPLCYGESLCQDHREECIKLNAQDIQVKNLLGPERVEHVAKAYYEAVKAFISSVPISIEDLNTLPKSLFQNHRKNDD